MRAWTYMLGGLLLWAVHFFGLYIIASLMLPSAWSRGLAFALTIIVAAGVGLLMKRATANWRSHSEQDFLRWVDALAMLGCAISFVAILWQALPAIIV